jgi:peptidoglycan/xylan/chitin deacetylase (PgdA/CDA1 family)
MNKFLQTTLLIALSLCTSYVSSFAQQRKVALLDLTTRNAEENTSRYRSVQWLLNTAGVEYTSTTSLTTALTYPVIVFSPVVKSSTFNSAERTSITNYVNNGGVIVCSSMQASSLFSLCGVSAVSSSTTRRYYNSTTTSLPWLYERITDPAETSIRFLGTSSGYSCTSRSYTLNGGTSLAQYEDGKHAFVYKATGQGHVYTFGIDLRDVVLRFQIDDDGNAQESYSNSFEPGADVFMLLIQNIVRHHIPNTVRVHTSPHCSSSSVIITHDYDSKTCQDTSKFFVDMEYERGVKATYNVTTSYYSNGWISGFYNTGVTAVQYILSKGHNVGSHSVGHFPDFENSTRFPLGTQGVEPISYHPLYSTTTRVTTGGNVFGEVEISKALLQNNHGINVKTFRSGELAYNKYLPYALQQTGYTFNSSFSANDVLTNFPFYTVDQKKYSGAQLRVLEIPMTISDVWTPSMSITNYPQKVAVWTSVTRKNDANNAPTVLLIHPNRTWKVTAEEMYLDSLPETATVITMEEFGEFWQERDTLDFTSTLSNNTLRIELNTNTPDERLSFVVDNANQLDGVTFFLQNGEEFFPTSTEWANGATLYCAEEMRTTALAETETASGITVYPNPASADVYFSIEDAARGNYTLMVYDVFGKTIHAEKMMVPSNGNIQFTWNSENTVTGCYFYSIEGAGKVYNGKIMVAH